jgi:2-polyprenyl-6-methoxyphenol hydroxylase-like FAD-dependent oxidoreductase
MLGLMLARQGVDVVVLEKHGDFLRDFRGDDIGPATIEILDELSLAEEFLALRPKRIEVVEAHTPGGTMILADLRLVRTKFPFFAVIPQWDFLDFITNEAARQPGFRLMLDTEATDVIHDQEEVRGVRCRSGSGTFEVRASLTVGADGRSSRVREQAGLPLTATAPPIDVLWFRLPRPADHPVEAAISIHLGAGQVMARIDRDAYWQVACVVAKGSAGETIRGDIAAFRATIQRCMPDITGTADGLRSWNQVSLLSVQTNRLRRWYRPGLICIGDAAHAMSPIGGAGINFAIGDAVAVANRLAGPIRSGHVAVRDLAAVQRERAWQVRLMQGLQSPLTRAYLVAADGDPGAAAAAMQRLGPRLVNLPGFRGVRSRVTALGFRKSRVAVPSSR